MVALGFTIAQGAVIAGQSFAKASAQKAEGDYISQLSRANAQLSRLRASQSIERGQEVVFAERRLAKQIAGRGAVAAAVGGTVVGTGSAADIAAQNEIFSIEAQRIISTNAFREAFGFKLEADFLQERARLARFLGRSRARSTLLAGTTAILGQFARISIGGPRAPTAAERRRGSLTGASAGQSLIGGGGSIFDVAASTALTETGF